MLRDLITEKEYEMMDMYRQLYSISDDGELVVDKSKMCPIRDLLAPWESEKSFALNRIFKDKLILDKHVHYEKSQTDIENDLDTYIFCPGSTNTRIKHSGYPFYQKFREFIIDRSYDESNKLSLVETRVIADGLYALIDTDSLAANKYCGDSFDLPMPDGKNLHDTEKPVKLMETLVRNSTKEGEVVMDFAMGIGSTGVACKNLNRGFIGMEIDPDYFRIAEQRIYYEDYKF